MERKRSGGARSREQGGYVFSIFSFFKQSRQWWLHHLKAIDSNWCLCPTRCTSVSTDGFVVLFWSWFWRKGTIFRRQQQSRAKTGLFCWRGKRWRVSKVARILTWWLFFLFVQKMFTHTPNFWPLPMECKCRNMVNWSRPITLDHRGSKRSNNPWQSQMVFLNVHIFSFLLFDTSF